MANDRVSSGHTIKLSELPPCAGGVSRRGFCAATGAGLITLGLSACDPGASRVGLGEIDNGAPGGVGGGGGGGGDDAAVGGGGMDAGAGGPRDLSTSGHPDLSQGGSSPDLAHPQMGGNCPAGTVNAGLASAVASGAAVYFSSSQYEFFLARDAGGLFALSATCPHAGCTVKKQATKYFCPCHSASWDLNGEKPMGPVFSALEHYAVCVDASGTALVDVNKVVLSNVRV
jgi:nitrite reductase/ring-hydroxylating ferredoxin subunit